MKTLLFTALLISLMFTSAATQAIDNGSTILLGGARFNAGEVAVAGGIGKHLSGPLWAVSTFDIGKKEVFWHNELMALFPVPGFKNLHAGVVAGESNEWVSFEGSAELLAYLQAAVGGVLQYHITEKVSLGGYAKWVIPLEDNLQEKQYVGGVAVVLRI